MNCFLYFEYIPGKSLKNVLETYGGLSETIIKKYLRSILEGLIFLFQKKLKIKTLKLSNILVELSGNIKLSDFIDYKSIIEFFEIYENSNKKNLRYSEIFNKRPFPWMLNTKSNFYNLNNINYQDDELQKLENSESETFNLSYLSYLMIEMITGNNAEYLQNIFKLDSDGNHSNENIKEKNFIFPCDVSKSFEDLFYFFSVNNKLNIPQIEQILMSHHFFNNIGKEKANI